MEVFGQIEDAVKVLVSQPPKGDAQYTIWLFVVALLVFGCAGFYVLRYMLIHAKEIHETSHRTISSLAATFSEECKEQRDQHHKDMIISRENVHDIRDVAQTAVTAKEFVEQLNKKQQARNPPPGSSI